MKNRIIKASSYREMSQLINEFFHDMDLLPEDIVSMSTWSTYDNNKPGDKEIFHTSINYVA